MPAANKKSATEWILPWLSFRSVSVFAKTVHTFLDPKGVGMQRRLRVERKEN
jgi:hypothetical protein